MRVCLIKSNSGNAQYVHLEHLVWRSPFPVTLQRIFNTCLKNFCLLFSAVISERFSKNLMILSVVAAKIWYLKMFGFYWATLYILFEFFVKFIYLSCVARSTRQTFWHCLICNFLILLHIFFSSFRVCILFFNFLLIYVRCVRRAKKIFRHFLLF